MYYILAYYLCDSVEYWKLFITNNIHILIQKIFQNYSSSSLFMILLLNLSVLFTSMLRNKNFLFKTFVVCLCIYCVCYYYYEY